MHRMLSPLIFGRNFLRQQDKYSAVRIDCLSRDQIQNKFAPFADSVQDRHRQQLDASNKQAHLYRYYNSQKRLWREMPFSKTPVDFDRLYINYLDAQVVGLLRRMKPLLSVIDLQLFHETSLSGPDEAQQICLPATVAALGQLLPLVSSIDKAYLDQRDLLILRDHFPTNLRDIKRIQCELKDGWNELMSDVLWEWLYNGGTSYPANTTNMLAEDEDAGGDQHFSRCLANKNKAKFMQLHVYGLEDVEQICKQLKERFTNSTKAANFSVNVWLDCKEDNVVEIKDTNCGAGIVENAVTGERLSIERHWNSLSHHWSVNIHRFGSNFEEGHQSTSLRGSFIDGMGPKFRKVITSPAGQKNTVREVHLRCPAMKQPDEEQQQHRLNSEKLVQAAKKKKT